VEGNANTGARAFDRQCDWKNPAVRIGAITLIVGAVVSNLPTLYLYLYYGAIPSVDVALRAWLAVAVTFGALYFVEPLTYYPVLGLTGTYMAFLAGNISNMRLPCSAAAQTAVGVESGTIEAEIVSTLGICGSVIMGTLLVALTALAGETIVGWIPASVKESFDFILPAIFGAIYGQFSKKFHKTALIALVITLPASFALYSLTQQSAWFQQHNLIWVVIVVAVFGTIAVSRVLYVKNKGTSAK